MLELAKHLVVVATVGLASQYGPGVMERVVHHRQSGSAWVPLPQETPLVDGFIAVRDCDRLGEIVLLRPSGTEEWEQFWVVDCARPGDGTAQWMDRHGILVEVDHGTAHRWDTVGLAAPIEVGWEKPRWGGIFP